MYRQSSANNPMGRTYARMGAGDVEDGWNSGGSKPTLDPSFEFAEKQVRLGFVRKVFGLLSAQFILTVGVCAAFMYNPGVKTYIFSNPWTLWTPLVLSIALILVMACSEQARRAHPWNLLLLTAFTACESVMLGTICASYDAQVVLLAAAVTAGVVLSLTIFTLQTKVDFTASSGILWSLLMTLIIAGMLQIFIHAAWLHIAIAAGGALLFSVYLVFDIQLLMGGGKYSISPEEHVFAALNIYLDVINIFLYVLQILNEMQRNN